GIRWKVKEIKKRCGMRKKSVRKKICRRCERTKVTVRVINRRNKMESERNKEKMWDEEKIRKEENLSKM
ncbi:hypothetical protein CP988_17925, partial [Enterococcus faecium]